MILYSMEIDSIYIGFLMEEQKDEVKKYLTSSVNPVLKPIVEAIAKARPPNIMKFILEYAQKQLQLQKPGSMIGTQRSEGSQVELTREEQEALKKKMENRRQKKEDGKKNSRRGISAEAYGEFNKKSQFKAKVIRKSQQSIGFIKKLLLKSIMFQSLSEENLKIVIDAMHERKVIAEELVIKEGEEGDLLYVIGDGQYECTKVIGGKKTYLKTYKPGEFFGELSLMYSAKRAATIKCTKPGTLFGLDRMTFVNIVQESAIQRRKDYENILSQIQILSDVQKNEREQLFDAMKEQKFDAEEYVVKEGENGDRLYFVMDGHLVAEKLNPQTRKPEIVFKYKQKEYFGEISLVKNTVRQASVKAVTKCKLLSIGREEFKRLCGPIQNILQRNIQKYKKFISK